MMMNLMRFVRFLFRSNVCVLSKYKYGCRVVQKGIGVMLHGFERENEVMDVFFEEIFTVKNALKVVVVGNPLLLSNT